MANVLKLSIGDDMTQTLTPAQAIFTPQEVATALRVSSETIRRKIVSGELHALEVGGKERKQYRIFSQDLVQWLGQERASVLFGFSKAVSELQAAWANVSDEEFDATLEEAIQHARDSRPLPEGPFAPALTSEEIAERFKHSRVKTRRSAQGVVLDKTALSWAERHPVGPARSRRERR